MVSRSIFRLLYYIHKKEERNKHNSCTQDGIMRHEILRKSRKCGYCLISTLENSVRSYCYYAN